LKDSRKVVQRSSMWIWVILDTGFPHKRIAGWRTRNISQSFVRRIPMCLSWRSIWGYTI